MKSISGKEDNPNDDAEGCFREARASARKIS